MNRYIILDEFGFIRFATNELPEEGVLFTEIDYANFGPFLKYKFDFQNNIWIEGSSQQEIEAANKIVVPDTISRMALKIQLLLKGIEIAEIIDTINSIPDYMFPQVAKQIAIIKFEEAAYFDRYNADLQLITTLMGLSQDDLDEMFINGNNQV